MGKRQQACVAEARPDHYRITQRGGEAVAAGHRLLDSRYLTDLLELLQGKGRSMHVCELRQFMPPASLEASIATLLEMGLIEFEDRACVPANLPRLALQFAQGA